MVTASGYFGDPVSPKDPGEDIVSRRRKAGDGGRRRRSRKDRWAFRVLRDVYSPVGLFGLLFIGAVTLAVAAGLHVFGGESVSLSGEEETVVPLEARPEGTFLVGDDLSVEEFSHASGFGRPLYLGDSGRPVVEVVVGRGERFIRELTGLEMAGTSPQPELVNWKHGVWYASGSSGLGSWWEGDYSEDAVRRSDVFRDVWVIRQEQLLFEALDDYYDLANDFVYAADRGQMDWGERILEQTRSLRNYYADGLHADWAGVPGRFSCVVDPDVLAGLPCPSDMYRENLAYIWSRYGEVVDRLEAVAVLHSSERHRSWGYDGDFESYYKSRNLDEAIRSFSLLIASLYDLALVGVNEDLPMVGLVKVVMEGSLDPSVLLGDDVHDWSGGSLRNEYWHQLSQR